MAAEATILYPPRSALPTRVNLKDSISVSYTSSWPALNLTLLCVGSATANSSILLYHNVDDNPILASGSYTTPSFESMDMGIRQYPSRCKFRLTKFGDNNVNVDGGQFTLMSTEGGNGPTTFGNVATVPSSDSSTVTSTLSTPDSSSTNTSVSASISTSISTTISKPISISTSTPQTTPDVSISSGTIQSTRLQATSANPTRTTTASATTSSTAAATPASSQDRDAAKVKALSTAVEIGVGVALAAVTTFLASLCIYVAYKRRRRRRKRSLAAHRVVQLRTESSNSGDSGDGSGYGASAGAGDHEPPRTSRDFDFGFDHYASARGWERGYEKIELEATVSPRVLGRVQEKAELDGGHVGGRAGKVGQDFGASPVHVSPVYASPMYTSPVYVSPVYTSPVYALPVYVSPVRGHERLDVPDYYGRGMVSPQSAVERKQQQQQQWVSRYELE